MERPKALCPVAGRPLVDLALDRLASVGLAGPADVAVNAHHLADQVVEAVDGRAYSSVEPERLGTGGAVGRLRRWIDGRAAVVVNVDAVHAAPLRRLLDGWSGERIRFLVAGQAGPLGASTRLCGVVMPAAAVDLLPASRCSIFDALWRPWESAGRTEAVGVPTTFFDGGTPASYLAANLWASGGATVVGEGSIVLGSAERSVLWPETIVRAGERLRDAIRTRGTTVLVRPL